MFGKMAVAAAVFVLGAGLAQAQPSGNGSGPVGAGHMRQQMMEKLNLSDQQKQEIGKLRAVFQKKQIEGRAKIQLTRVDLRQQVMSETPDQATIRKLVSSISDLEQEQKLALVDHLFAVRNILTPEQRKEWKQGLMQLGMEARGRMNGFMQRGRGTRPIGMEELPEPAPGDDLGDLLPPPPPDEAGGRP